MKPIDKFILHVVHSWPFLTEAKADIERFFRKFREEADDLNIIIDDENLKKAIDAFDTFKNSPNVAEKDLAKYSLNQLLRLVKSTPTGFKTNSDEEITPDMVYHDNGIYIYSGDVEGKCIIYGKGERWCITKGSYSNYRYDSGRGYPVFYLVRNTNLPNNNPLSFVAIQVRNDGNYVYTGRDNSPYESKVMDFSKLESEIPYLKDIPNVRELLKYIPPSPKVKDLEQKFRKGITFQEWSTDLDFEQKKNYIIIKQSRGSNLFDNMSAENFIRKVLPKYDKLAEWACKNPWIIDSKLMLNNIELFKPNFQKSIIFNTNTPGHEPIVDYSDIRTHNIPFSVSKALIELNRIQIKDYNFYITADGKTIVSIAVGKKSIEISLTTEDDYFDNINLNRRTQKYLFDYPKLDEIPFAQLAKIIQDKSLDTTPLKTIISNAKESNDGAKRIVDVNGKEILFDTGNNDVKIYQLSEDSIKSIKLSSPGIKEAFLNIAASNPSILKNIVDSVLVNEDPSFSEEDLISLFTDVPANILINNDRGLIVFNNKLYGFPSNPNNFEFRALGWREGDDSFVDALYLGNSERMNAYAAFLRKYNLSFNDISIKNVIERNINDDSIPVFADTDIPYDEGSILRPQIINNRVWLINIANPNESYKRNRNSLVTAPAPRTARTRITPAIPAPAIAAAAGEPEAAAPIVPAVPGAPRRGRPAGGGVIRQVGEINAALIGALTDANLLDSFNSLPAGIRARFSGDATVLNPRSDRGASRRNNNLGNRGRVVGVRAVGSSAMYFINLQDENNTAVVSLVAQPGNSHWLLTPAGAIQLDSPANLLTALQQRNLAEAHHYIVNDYLGRHPEHLDEIREMLKKHIAETKTN